MSYLYNSIDIQHIEECIGVVARTTIKKELGITRRPVVGVVARLRSEKGHSFLLHAMKRVAQTMPRTVLLIIGDGPDKSELQALAENLLLVDNVRWLGSKPHEEILALYGIMDIVAVPSEYEGFGLSAAEAMAAGVPVVASDVGGLREVVDAGTTGLLVPYGAADEMSEALLSLLRDPASARRMGKLGRENRKTIFIAEIFLIAHCGVQSIFMTSEVNISVIMPLYNNRNEVERALRSIAAQTVSGYEVIVVNDGSTDDGEKVVRGMNNPHVRIINQENKGVSAARNRGVGEAENDLVAFLDADDEWNPDFLETIVRIVQKLYAMFCVCDTLLLQRYRRYPSHPYSAKSSASPLGGYS